MSASITEQFTTWVRSKPADEEYDYYSPYRCAYAQFASAHGIPFGPGYFRHLNEKLRGDLAGEPSTFGALLNRLEASA